MPCAHAHVSVPAKARAHMCARVRERVCMCASAYVHLYLSCVPVFLRVQARMRVRARVCGRVGARASADPHRVIAPRAVPLPQAGPLGRELRADGPREVAEGGGGREVQRGGRVVRQHPRHHLRARRASWRARARWQVRVVERARNVVPRMKCAGAFVRGGHILYIYIYHIYI